MPFRSNRCLPAWRQPPRRSEAAVNRVHHLRLSGCVPGQGQNLPGTSPSVNLPEKQVPRTPNALTRGRVRTTSPLAASPRQPHLRKEDRGPRAWRKRRRLAACASLARPRGPEGGHFGAFPEKVSIRVNRLSEVGWAAFSPRRPGWNKTVEEGEFSLFLLGWGIVLFAL